MWGEGEELVRIGLVENKIVLYSINQFSVLGGDICVDIDWVLQVEEGLFVAFDGEVDEFICLVD